MSERHDNWWRRRKGDVHDAVCAHVKALDSRERTRLWRDHINERIYSSNVGQGVGRAADMATILRSIGFQSADLNFTRQIVDALVARVGNDRPAIRVAADGAAWSLRRKAKLLDKLIAGEMDALDIEAKAPLGLRDCLTTRAGIMKVVPDDGQIVADLVPVEELRVDPREARYGQPRQLHHVKQVAREVLARKFSDSRAAAAAIREANAAKGREMEAQEQSDAHESPMVDVIESWHLPSKKGAKDGRHTVCIEGATLLDEPWERTSFPFAILRWSPPRKGMWGPTLVDELAALQYKVNEIARDLMQNIYFTSAVKVLHRRGAEIEKKHLAGKKPHYIAVEAIGTDVQWDAPDGFSLAQFQFLQWLIQQMYEVSGVSQLMAQSKNPLGAGASGAALDSFYDIESERFSQLELAYARFWRDIGALIVEAARELADDDAFRSRDVRWVKRSMMQKLKWADVLDDLADDRFELRLEPSGFLPRTRAGKLKAIEQLAALQLVDPEETLSLLDFPDLRRVNDLKAAQREVIERALERVIDCEVDDDGQVVADTAAEMPAPDPHWNLELAMRMSKAAYNAELADDAPEGIRQRYIAWLGTLDTEIKKAKAAAPAPAAAGMPPGAAGPPMDMAAMGAPPPDVGMPPMGVAA